MLLEAVIYLSSSVDFSMLLAYRIMQMPKTLQVHGLMNI